VRLRLKGAASQDARGQLLQSKGLPPVDSWAEAIDAKSGIMRRSTHFNGITEGFNNGMEMLQRQAWGFGDF
jgi:hypothetical protein